MKPGLYHNMPEQEYREIEALNCSTLVACSETLAHGRVRKETPAMSLGTLVHSFLLEPDKAKDKYALLPPDCRIGSGKGQRSRLKAWQGKNEGKEIMSQADWDAVQGIHASLRRDEHTLSCGLIDGSEHEVTAVWKDRKYGVLCKARYDCLYQQKIIADLKVTMTANPEKWFSARLRAGAHPHWQAAWYLRGIQHFHDVKEFWWILIEKTPPHNITVVETKPRPNIDGELQTSQLTLAQLQLDAIVPKVVQAQNTGKWPGYKDELQPAPKIPQWYLNNALI